MPFLRPAEIAHDTATDYQLFDHFLRLRLSLSKGLGLACSASRLRLMLKIWIYRIGDSCLRCIRDSEVSCPLGRSCSERPELGSLGSVLTLRAVWALGRLGAYVSELVLTCCCVA